MKWRIWKKENGQWDFVGAYGEKSVEQLGAAISDLTRKGYVMYESIRVEELPDKEA